MTVRIAAQFTKDERDRNGLIPAAGQIAANSHDWNGVAVVRLDCVRVTDEIKDGGVLIPTVGIRHIELVDGDDATEVEKILARAYETRTGRTPLPLDELGGETDADLLEGGPVAERDHDEWLDNGEGGK